MKNRHSSTFVRLGLAALLAAPVALGALAAGTPAGATTALPFDTKFEIDGNPQVNSTGDWLSTAAQYPELRDNFVTTAEPCGPGSDPNRFKPGTKLHEINVNDASPFIESGNVLTKGDVCAVRRAWELVLVPEDPEDATAGGQYHFISYLAWSRLTTQGEINVLIPLLGANSSSQADDVVVSYDFDDNTGVTTLSFLKWDGEKWVDHALPAGSYEAVTAEGVTDPAVPGENGTNLTFGEYAIDLTAAGLLPENGPCLSFSNGALASRTGNSPQATLEDAVALPPLNLTNCSSLNIVKQTTPTPTSPKEFGYNVHQVDGAQMQPGVTQINGSITVPPNPNTTTINNLLISPDYVVGETSMPTGWTEQTLVCTSSDPLTGQLVTRTLYNGQLGPDSSFPLGPNVQATCTITNLGPPRVDVTKTVQGTTTPWAFDFTISPVPAGETATKTATNTAPTVGWDGLVAGTAYTITEATEAGYINGAVNCDGDGTFTPTPGQSVTCAVTNTELGSVDVTKHVVGSSDDWAFDFTISPDPDGEGGQDATQTATAEEPTVSWDGLDPSVEYTISEDDVDGFISGDISCGEGGDSFTPAPGENVECDVTNTELIALGVAATANASFDRTVGWSLDKSAAPASQTGSAGQDAGTSTWTVVATKTVTLGNFGVTGTVTVTNSNGFVVPVAITPTLNDGTGVDLNCPSLSVPANGSLECTFTATPSGSTATLATALVTPTDPILDAVSANASVSFAANVIGDDTVTVDDDRDADGQFPAEISSSTTFDYDETFPCSSNPGDYTNFSRTDTYPNTATLTGETTNLTDSASVSVTCNLPPASVDVTKTVAGDAATWSFDFTISPVPAGETATKAATNSASTVGWDGLVPGTAYTITETDVSGFITGTLSCTGGTNAGGTSTFTPGMGQAVTCAITNDVVEQQAPPIADIAVTKTATPTVVTPGGNVTWTLKATNNGPDAADNAMIVDNLPASLTLVSFTSAAGWDCSGTVTGNPGKLSCTKPTMGVGESATFTLTTTVAASAAGQTINNTAVVSTSTSETTTSNNQDSEPISVQVAVLPPTGGYVWNRLAIAAGLVLAGLALVAIDRRRRIIS